MSTDSFDLSSTERTSFDDGNYTYELYNQNGKLMIDIRSNNVRIQKAKPINITVPDTIDYSINLHQCFYDHRYLEDISALESFDTSHVTDMSSMFYNCRKLKDCNALSSWNVSNVTDMSSMFYNCRKLKDCRALSSWNVSNVTNMPEMFYNCYELRVYNALSSWDVSKVMDMSGMFYCYKYRDDDLQPLSNWNVHERCVLSGFRSQGIGYYDRDINSPIIGLHGWDNNHSYPYDAARIRKTSPQWLLDRDAAQRNRRT